MSFAAEPYGVFVDDLVSSLTGGVTREAFVFVPEQEPFRLAAGAAILVDTVRAHGLVDGDYHRFSPATDFAVVDGVLQWRADPAGAPLANATWPDRGSTFWVSYERTPDPQRPPLLSDRNPGSVVRTLAESFAREFAVVSRQLASVYEASFVETASGRDLDQLAALVGVTRRGRTHNSGEVVFSRTSPARGDIFIPEGALISTGDAPAITVETTAAATLRSGTLSVAAPVQAQLEGVAGAAAAGTLTVLHRPISGITSVTNPQPLSSNQAESDEMLRRRVVRALDTGGRSTVGALIGALTSVEGIREQDVRIVEDHVGAPGVVKVTVAAELDDDSTRLAASLIDRYRPAGVRVLHNLPVAADAVPDPGAGGGGGGEGPAPAPASAEGSRFPVGVRAAVTPASARLTGAEKEALVAAVGAAIEAQVEDAGVGEVVIYNRVVQAIMAIEGVYDVVVDIYPRVEGVDAPATARHNLHPTPPDTRPELAELDVTLRGAMIALDVTAEIQSLGIAATGDPATVLDDARRSIIARLGDAIPSMPTITPSELRGALTATDDYSVDSIGYTAEFVEEGLRVRQPNVTITPQGDQQVVVRSVAVTSAVLTGATP